VGAKLVKRQLRAFVKGAPEINSRTRVKYAISEVLVPQVFKEMVPQFMVLTLQDKIPGLSAFMHAPELSQIICEAVPLADLFIHQFTVSHSDELKSAVLTFAKGRALLESQGSITHNFPSIISTHLTLTSHNSLKEIGKR